MQGTKLSGYGQLLNNEMLMLVHIDLKKGRSIPAHDHVGQEVFFTLAKGLVKITLNETEIHVLEAGEVLRFAGESSIGVYAEQDSEFFVYLINR